MGEEEGGVFVVVVVVVAVVVAFVVGVDLVSALAVAECCREEIAGFGRG